MVNDYLLCLVIKATAQPSGQCPLQTMPGERGCVSAHARTTHTGIHSPAGGRHLSLPEISVNVYAGHLRLPWVVPGDLAQKRRGYGWL